MESTPWSSPEDVLKMPLGWRPSLLVHVLEMLSLSSEDIGLHDS